MRNQGQGAHAARRDLAIQVRDLVYVQAEDVRNRGEIHDALGAERGQLGLDAGQVVRVRDVVAHDEGALGRGAAHEVLDLQGQQAALRAQLLEVFRDLGGDAPDHFHALHDGGDVAHCCAVAHF